AIGAQSVTEGANLNFDISATDPDATTPAFTAEDVPTNATFVDHGDGTGAFDFNPNYIQVGVYNVRFIADDGTLADTEIVAITVNEAGNQVPTLAAIGAQSVTEGANLNFSISATDPDSTIPAFTAEDVPTNATFVDHGDGTGTFNFNPNYIQAGVYNVRFIADDGSLADTEIVEITVNEAGSQFPVLAAIGPQSVLEGTNLNFGISAADPDSTIPGLTAEDMPANATFIDHSDGTGTFDFNPNYIQAGIYDVRFIASDGSLADTEIVTVTVNEAGNQTPIIDPIGNHTLQEGETLNIRTSATDPDADSVIWATTLLPTHATFVDSGNGAGGFVFTPDYNQSGTYFITFFASDTAGAQADELVRIDVFEAGNQVPVADAGPDQLDLTAGSLVTLDGTASYDLEGDSLSHTWLQVAGPVVSLSNDNIAQPTFTPAIKGTYIFELTVYDGQDYSIPDSVTVTVLNQDPTADAGPDQDLIPISSLVTLDGSGSSDPDGDSLGYHWSQTLGPAVTLSDSNALDPQFTPTIGGAYEFQLIVDDGVTVSIPDVVTITISSQPARITTLNASVNGETIELTWQPVTLDTSGTPTVVDRYIIYRGTRAYFTPGPVDSIGGVDGATGSFTDADLNGADVVGDTATYYFYTVAALDAAGNQSDPSNRVGECDYVIVTTSTTSFNYISVPFDSTGLEDADDLIAVIGAANVNTVSRFVSASQSFESRFALGFGVNFPVIAGGIYQVNAKSDLVWTVAGRVPDPGMISYSVVVTSTTDFSFISIPFENELDYTTAQDVIDALPGVLNTLNRYIPASQAFESRFAVGFGVNFRVRPGGVYQTNAKVNATFPTP
ncbi:Ig-like domain-containing protein, partial [Candidatus Zixiibacteriota bacterium]